MKQTLFMIALTCLGAFGVLIEPFLGVAVYYLFAVLRPQYLWQWALPADIQWSLYVAIPTMIAAVFKSLGGQSTVPTPTADPEPRHFAIAHFWLLCFAAWIVLSTVTAINTEEAHKWLIEYAKIFTMFFCAAVLISRLRDLWTLYLIAALSLSYIAYEVNFLYLVNGYLGIYHNGYGGLDNNGAGLILAMGVPLCIFAWEASTRIWRWFFVAMLPVLVHAMLMTYSRGAMVALLAICPLIVLRSRHRRAMTIGALCFALAMPTLAGPEIRARFFTLENYQDEESAISRFGSWRAAWEIAKDYPLLGVGLRNSPLISHNYGADSEGRVIHNQYLQVAADSGFPALVFYLAVIGATWHALRRARLQARARKNLPERRAYGMACGLESSLGVFMVGACFLSLELFELPFLLLLLGAQLPLVLRVGEKEAQQPLAMSPVTTMPRLPRVVVPRGTSAAFHSQPPANNA